ncbi:proline-rich transmembrane protein 2-like [Sesamum indicum]|uniref:Proline-rich transmembrane protein 2-like n=1 Tax=Sesamum indicum TaxID=4182 RepID=A0A6I9T6Z6_SESIN|nr:proline-rich transmembrane protein 2-like [Sesamum indicum]
MQKGKEPTSTMPPPKDSDPLLQLPSEPTKAADHQPGSENPLLVPPEKTKGSLEESKSEKEGSALQEPQELINPTPSAHTSSSTTTAPSEVVATVEEINSSGRERLKRHRVEVAGRVWIPEMWGQEELLKDWIDCTAFDATLMNSTNKSLPDLFSCMKVRQLNDIFLAAPPC